MQTLMSTPQTEEEYVINEILWKGLDFVTQVALKFLYGGKVSG
jgi:hypothetical protein